MRLNLAKLSAATGALLAASAALAVAGCPPRSRYVSYEDRTIHTNTVEGAFSIFKRGMKGFCQHCGERHLHRYLPNSRSAITNMKRTASTT
jgi:hypothetical protein